MSFFQGLITGAATSIDTQLKKDMERTQERAEGMAQYRVTRRRAEIERQEKEKREVSDVLNKLAGLVDGDVDKAAQLYVSGGKSVTGANALYDELKKNADAGKDISTAITFAEARSEPGQMTDYVSRFITPISTLPPIKGEIKGAGLYGAMFKPDLAKSVMAQVDEEAPISPVQQFTDDTAPTAAKIDRTGFLAAEEYKQKQREIAMGEERFDVEMAKAGRDVTLDDLNQKKLKQAMRLADDAAKLAQDKFASDEAQRKLNNANAEVEALQRQAKLIQEAEAHVLNIRKAKRDIEMSDVELAKAKDHPQFKDFEDQAVYAAGKLAMDDLTEQEREDYQTLYDNALSGAAEYAAAEDTSAGVASAVEFSEQSLDSILQGAAKFELDKVPSESVGNKIKYAIDGNEAAYYGGMARAIKTVENRLTSDDGTISPQARRYLDSLRESNTQKLYNFAIKQQQEYTSGSPAQKKRSKFISFDKVESGVNQLRTSNTDLSDAEALKQWARNNAEAGSIVPMDSAGTVFGVWTGSRFLQAKDMGR